MDQYLIILRQQIFVETFAHAHTFTQTEHKVYNKNFISIKFLFLAHYFSKYRLLKGH